MTVRKRTIHLAIALPVLIVMTLMAIYLGPGLFSSPPQTSAVAISSDTPIAAEDHTSQALSIENFIAAEERRIEEERLAAEEARRVAEEAERRAAARAATSSPQRNVASFDLPSECSGKPIPAHIVMRESGCNYGAVNQTGCSGYTCVGMYQFDMRHWVPKEEGGWGGCAWLGDWRIPENQDACASQMSRNGTNLAPWGG